MLNSAIKENARENRGLCLVNDVPGHGLKNREKFQDIVGQSAKMQEIFTLVEKVADSDSTIIINGESGTGKGLIARAIHKNSDRSKWFSMNWDGSSMAYIHNEIIPNR